MTDKTEFQIDVEHVESMLSDELQGLDLHVAEREIGNGPQFALESHKTGSSTQLTESYWYEQNEFEAFCAGMKYLERLMRTAEKERSDE